MENENKVPTVPDYNSITVNPGEKILNIVIYTSIFCWILLNIFSIKIESIMDFLFYSPAIIILGTTMYRFAWNVINIDDILILDKKNQMFLQYLNEMQVFLNKKDNKNE